MFSKFEQYTLPKKFFMSTLVTIPTHMLPKAIETSLTDNAGVIIYDRHMFIVQATGFISY